MSASTLPVELPLADQVAARVLETTHGRIQQLRVEEIDGSLVVHGRVPSFYTKQLALHGISEVVRAHESVRERIEVG